MARLNGTIKKVMRSVHGLAVMPGFLSDAEQTSLLAIIGGSEWSNNISRRVRQYGYAYDHREKALAPDYLGPLPEWSDFIQDRLREQCLLRGVLDQIIINEYEPGQGIAQHIDLETAFGEPVVSVSLGAPTMMEFLKDGEGTIELWIVPGTAVIMTGPARWEWGHRIRKRKSDTLPSGDVVPRARRVSVTFRKVLQSIAVAEEQVRGERT